MDALQLLSRTEMRNITAGAGFNGCYFQCCYAGGTCYGPGTSVDYGDSCSSHAQCQSDYLAQQLDPCAGTGGYLAALCYN